MSGPKPWSQRGYFITNRQLAVFASVVVSILVMLPIGIRVFNLYTFAAERDQGRELIDKLRMQRPANVNKEGWENSVSWLQTGYYNVFSSVDNPTKKHLTCYISELESELSHTISSNTVGILWARLSCAGPFGREYIAKFDPDFRRSFETISDDHYPPFLQLDGTMEPPAEKTSGRDDAP